MSSRYMYLTRRHDSPLESQNLTGDAWSVSFSIHRIVRQWDFDDKRYIDDFDDEATLTGKVDWQDGLTIWQSENIEPGDFISIMATAHEAICEARKLIGGNWRLGGLSEPEPDPAA